MYQVETYVTVEGERRCVRGARCVGRDMNRQPSLSHRPLCDPCTTELADIIGALPKLMLELRKELAPGYQSIGDAPVSGGDPEPKLLLNENVDELIRQVASVAREWADRVRQVADLYTPHPRPDPYLSVNESVATLTYRTSVLLALAERGEPRAPVHDQESEPRRLGGGDAALEFFWLYYRGQSVTGQIRRVVKFSVPCPGRWAIIDDEKGVQFIPCGVPACAHWDGEEYVWCQACGASWLLMDDWLAGPAGVAADRSE